MKPTVVLLALAMTACSPPPPASSPTSTRSAPTSLPRTRQTTPAGGAAGLSGTDRLESSSHLAEALPQDSPHYRIDFAVAADGRLNVRVTLLAVLNHPRDLAAYQAELRRYRAEALAFIQAQGDDPGTYTVTFIPDPAAPSPKEGP